MSVSRVKCLHCGAEIQPTTATATGGYCRSAKCEAYRKATKQAEQQRSTVEKRIESGALKPCPLCGALVRSSKFEDHVAMKCEKRTIPHPFADVLPRNQVPDWLLAVASESELPNPIPLSSILADSCFYPASGLDASPVIILNGFLHSFVFVDYGIKREDFQSELCEVGFRGYMRILARDVQRDEVVPSHWQSRMPGHYDEFNGMNRLIEAQRSCVPFGHWSVWRRLDNFDDHIGPALFSLFFLAGEGIASFQGLYERNIISPKAVAIIQPGHAFGNNWTNFFNSDGPFWQALEGASATPDHLLIGTFGDSREKPEDCPFHGYHFVRRTRTCEPAKEEHTYNTEGDTSRSFLVASMLSKDSGFKIASRTVRGMSHTIDIFKKDKRPNKSMEDNG